MAPAAEHEILACLGNNTKHERKQHDCCATEYQISVNEDQTKSELHCRISWSQKKHFNTFMIAQLKFGQTSASIVLRPRVLSYTGNSSSVVHPSVASQHLVFFAS